MFGQQHLPEDLMLYMHACRTCAACCSTCRITDREEGDTNMEAEANQLLSFVPCYRMCLGLQAAMLFILNHACCNANRQGCKRLKEV